MSIHDVAADFTAMLQRGAFEEAAEAYWSEDVSSIEPAHTGAPPAHGLTAVAAKGEAWSKDNEVHGFEAKGPYVNGDQFSVFMSLDVTNRTSGERSRMDEVALYTVRDGKVVEERFFY